MSDAPAPIEAAEAGTFAITGPGEYLARDGTRMRVLEFRQGLGYWLGRHSSIDSIIGFAWRPDGTNGLPNEEGRFDLVARASSPQTKEG